MALLFLLTLALFLVPVSYARNGKEYCCGPEWAEKLVGTGGVMNCPNVFDRINDCCRHHDHCYRDKRGRQFCDNKFCICVYEASNDEKWYAYLQCKWMAAHYCGYVQVGGWIAYENRRRAGFLNQTSIYKALLLDL